MGRVLFASRQNAPKSINAQALTASDGANGLNPPPRRLSSPCTGAEWFARGKVQGCGGGESTSWRGKPRDSLLCNSQRFKPLNCNRLVFSTFKIRLSYQEISFALCGRGTCYQASRADLRLEGRWVMHTYMKTSSKLLLFPMRVSLEKSRPTVTAPCAVE